jgi:hypothetical protein
VLLDKAVREFKKAKKIARMKELGLDVSSNASFNDSELDEISMDEEELQAVEMLLQVAKNKARTVLKAKQE